jgi:hypothetical protein
MEIIAQRDFGKHRLILGAMVGESQSSPTAFTLGRDEMGKLPAIQFYPGDWRKDVGVQSLAFHDRGVWFEILMLMHESERRGVLTLNGKPMSDDALARLLGLDKQILTTTLSELITTGVASREPDTGALMCRRMVRDESLRKTRTEAGKKGGNPALLIQKTTTEDKQKSTPSSSSSVSTTKDTAHPITPEMVTQGVLSELCLSGRDLAVAITEVCRASMDKGALPGDLRDEMIAAWRQYEVAKPSLTFTKGAKNFFGEGDWRNSAGWPWKDGQKPKRKAAPKYDTSFEDKVAAAQRGEA